MRERKRPESNKNREPKVEAFTKLTFLNKHIRVGKWEFKGTNSVISRNRSGDFAKVSEIRLSLVSSTLLKEIANLKKI